jgi:alginate O-acetyltransferase complex protein AlgI
VAGVRRAVNLSSSASSSTRTSSPTTSTRCSALGLRAVDVPRVLLPIGISFFTFHAISYVVDVYRRDATAQKSPVHAALYLLLFPQLIAGPIIRYRDIADQLARRIVSARRLRLRRPPLRHRPGQEGADRQRRRRPGGPDLRDAVAELSAAHAWLGIVCYTLQIYFDFSGYSDMAIGLGRMFGFRFPRTSAGRTSRQRAGVLAPVAHLAVDLVPRLPLHPARRQPRQPGAPLPNLVTVFFLLRPLARRELELRHLGLWHGAFLVVDALRRTAAAAEKNDARAVSRGDSGVLSWPICRTSTRCSSS